MPVSKMARNKGTDMGNWVSRKQATEIINATFSMFHYGLTAMPDMGIKNTKEKEDFLRAAWKLDETIHTDDYADTVNALDTTGFKEYYNLIGAFAKKYKIANWKDYSTYEPVLIEHLNEELGRHEKTEEKLELINSFHDEELCSETFPSASKIRVLYDILDDCFVLDNKENGINRILRTFNENDKTAFITKIQSDDKLLASFIKKVNGGEKDEMLATIGEIFISSGFIKDRKTVLLDNKKTDTLTASLNKGKIYIKMESLAESTNLVPDGMGDYPNISRRTVTVSPFDIVRMYYDGRLINVPALLLLNSWSNSMAEPEGLFYNYRHEDIDWNSLSDEKKDEYFSEFVKHYMDEALFSELIGNPLGLILATIVGILLSYFAAIPAAVMAVVGAGIAGANIYSGTKMLSSALEEKQKASNMHEYKKAAKLFAKSISKIGVNTLMLIVSLVQTVKAFHKGKELKICEKSSNQNTIITSDMEEKILEGKRIFPDRNEIIGGHSNVISNENEKFVVEVIAKNSDGTKVIKYIKDFGDGSISKIKKSTIFPDSWSETEIISAIKKTGNSSIIAIRAKDGATFHRQIINGVEIDVIKINNEVVSGYPTGKVNAPYPSGF